jgi:hypothetical protein
MDYSAVSTDPDHPAGPSPWGSPRADRNTFPASNNDIPSSPLPGQDRSAEETEGSHVPVPQSPDLSAQLQSPQLGDPDYAEGQSPLDGSQQHSQGLPTRYQTGLRQNTRPPAPAYKIQAKITSLERTGKKDPILRFDVHVGRFSNKHRCTQLGRRTDYHTCYHRPISPSSVLPSTVMSAVPMPNSPNSPTT